MVFKFFTLLAKQKFHSQPLALRKNCRKIRVKNFPLLLQIARIIIKSINVKNIKNVNIVGVCCKHYNRNSHLAFNYLFNDASTNEF